MSPHKLVNSTRRVRKKLIRVEAGALHLSGGGGAVHQDWVWWHKQALPLGSDSEQAGEHSSGVKLMAEMHE